MALSKSLVNKAGQHHRHGYKCSVCDKVMTSHWKLSSPLAATPRDKVLSGGTAHAKEEKLHQCSLCHRTFPSGQALGRHKTSHWKPPSAVPRDEDEASFGDTAHTKEEKLHQCSLCHRTFPSGQALGAWAGTSGCTTRRTRTRTPPGTKEASVAAVATAVVRDFDLNLSAEADGVPPDAKRACTDDSAAMMAVLRDFD
ncbi:Zinc finger protein AZF1 [Zea mays]|jgi:ribosomal protein L37AE/L43A|uniref:Zinc finger protein AZF1 n=1 Tax=Zea mays TaxID=4577 RepID=A0A1D6NFW2_MAIZE|nr:Zinc finger protein AZF1 [Zea mays]